MDQNEKFIENFKAEKIPKSKKQKKKIKVSIKWRRFVIAILIIPSIIAVLSFFAIQQFKTGQNLKILEAIRANDIPKELINSNDDIRVAVMVTTLDKYAPMLLIFAVAWAVIVPLPTYFLLGNKQAKKKEETHEIT